MKTNESVITVDPKKPIDVLKWSGQAIQAEQTANGFVITTDDDSKAAVDYLKQIQVFGKEAEDARKEKKEPFFQMGKIIDNAFSPISEKLKSASDTLKKKILSWQAEQERIRQEEEKRRKEEYEAKRLEEMEKEAFSGASAPAVATPTAPPPVLLPQTKTAGAIGTASQRKVWRFKVVNLAEVPRELLIIDEMAVKDRIRDGARSIPGLEIYQETQLSVR